MSAANPILNNPYLEPTHHYATDLDSTLNYEDVREGRRIFTPDIGVIRMGQGPHFLSYSPLDN